jgi:hypothetical protein
VPEARRLAAPGGPRPRRTVPARGRQGGRADRRQPLAHHRVVARGARAPFRHPLQGELDEGLDLRSSEFTTALALQ